MSKATAMKILGLVGGAIGVAYTAYRTGNWQTAVTAGVTALVAGIAGWVHPSPAAVASFGASAK